MMQRILISTACGLIGLAVCFGQAPAPKEIVAVQRFEFMGPPAAGTMIAINGPNPVTGKPLSATQETRTLQVLGDGTRIERTDTRLFYRDEQGRTRMENSGDGGPSTVMISDPVAGVTFMLDPAKKTARKLPMPPPPPPGAATATAIGEGGRVAALIKSPELGNVTYSTSSGAGQTIFVHAEARVNNHADANSEDLGTQSVNGVMAQGTRSTITIPAGQIGNDRPIQTISERWFSNDLQMLVRSSTKDPRFGDVTFQLTNIVQAPPAKTLFQIPPDYTIQEAK